MSDLPVPYWLATFEREVWVTLTTNAVSPALGVMASPELQAHMEQVAAGNSGSSRPASGSGRAEGQSVAMIKIELDQRVVTPVEEGHLSPGDVAPLSLA